MIPDLDDCPAAGGKSQVPHLLLCAGISRLGRDFNGAKARLDPLEANIPSAWHPAWQNESASLAWHMGHTERARAMWQAQPDSIPVLFNRGMAALFSDQPVVARANLAATIEKLPATSAWHHLARVYLVLAEMRG
jgi:hypothetical protein